MRRENRQTAPAPGAAGVRRCTCCWGLAAARCTPGWSPALPRAAHRAQRSRRARRAQRSQRHAVLQLPRLLAVPLLGLDLNLQLHRLAVVGQLALQGWGGVGSRGAGRWNGAGRGSGSADLLSPEQVAPPSACRGAGVAEWVRRQINCQVGQGWAEGQRLAPPLPPRFSPARAKQAGVKAGERMDAMPRVAEPPLSPRVGPHAALAVAPFPCTIQLLCGIPRST